MILLEEIEFPIQVDDILFSTQERMNSIWKIFSMDDKGTLNVHQNRIHYKGMKSKFNIKNIERISSAKQKPGYGAYFVSGFLCVAVIWYTFLFLHNSIEYFLLFFLIIIILYPVSLFFGGSEWTEINYKDHGETKKVYFSEGNLPKDSVLYDDNTSKKSDSLFRSLKFVELSND